MWKVYVFNKNNDNYNDKTLINDNKYLRFECKNMYDVIIFMKNIFKLMNFM